MVVVVVVVVIVVVADVVIDVIFADKHLVSNFVIRPLITKIVKNFWSVTVLFFATKSSPSFQKVMNHLICFCSKQQRRSLSKVSSRFFVSKLSFSFVHVFRLTYASL